MSRKRILQSIQLDKIAAVDRPCQEGAVVTILKRAPDAAKKASLSLADQIAKDLIVLPMAQAMPDDDDKAKSFGEALQETIECDAWWKGKEELRPFVDALRDSLVSIFIDASLDAPTRALKIRDTVGQFLDTIQLKYAEAVPVIEQAVMDKRVRELRKRLLLAKTGVAMLSNFIVQKAWTDEARKKAAEARKLAGEHRRQEQHHNKISSGHASDAVSHKHGLAASLHSHAARTYEEAERHYNSGDMHSGDEAISRASAVYGSVANEFSIKHQIMAKERAEGARRSGEAHQRRGAHFGPPRSKGGRRRPRASLPKKPHARGHGRGRQGERGEAEKVRTGPRQLPGGERKRLLAAHHHRQKHKKPKKLKHMARRHLARRPLHKDLLGRMQAVITKSAIVLAACPDPIAHIRKAIGDTAADYIRDFVQSDNSRFLDKSKEDRIRMALGAFYGRP